ncbi:PAS domain S-box protein [Roseateles albus]|uniref:histidine kinase n=1 Tax=Roseateles albus TaxID=2987525 RepID=A0ABT5KFQ5_9BURK|nr:PAS domain S-box protein [Roseateles albus]MDC8771795.1 PAS domain S-box protein [Roseateles albus]
MTPVVPFQTLLDCLPYSIFIKDAGSCLLYVSPACAETWGVKASEIVGTRGEGFFPEDQLESFWALDRQILAGGNPVSLREVFWSARYQSNRLGFTTKSPVCDVHGSPQYLVCTTLDITDEGQAQERAKLLETVMQAASVGVVITGPDRRVLSSNPAFSKITGYDPEEVLGRTLAFLQGEDTDAQDLARLSDALRTAVPFEGVLRNYSKDGKGYWNELSIAPVLAEDGALTHFVGVNRDITEGREARHLLETRERQYRELVEKLHLGLVVHEPDGRIKLVNPRALHLLGLSEAQMLGTTPIHPQWQLSTTDGAPYPPDQIPSTLAAATGKPVRNAILGVYRPVRQDTVWLQINADPELDIQGQVVQVAVTLADITEMRETQSNLRAAQEQAEQLAGHLQAVLDNMGDGVITIDPQGCILSFNVAASAIFGYTTQEIVGQPVHNLMPPPHKELHDSYMAHYADTGAPRDLHGQRKNGQVFPMNLRVSQIDRAGVQLFVGIVRDITERKKAEISLRASETRRKVATDSGRLAVWEVDIASNRLIWDDNCFVLYRMSKENFTGKFEEWARTIHPQDLDAVMQTYQQAIAGIRGYHLTFRILWPDGSVRFIEAHGDVIRGDDGVATGMIGVNWDITEQKSSEDALRASVVEKSALLKEVHHRVKNNLQVITSLLRMEAGRSLVADTKEVLGDMRGRIRTMAHLHESLYRSGTFASVDLGVYLSQVATQAFKAQELHRDSVRLTLSFGSVQSGMDQAQATGLLLNELISNCLKHGFPEGQTGEVSVEFQPANDQANPLDVRWCLCVRDTGVGLPADFEEKRQASLGLQLVTDLSNQLGGTLVIDSVPGAGARFNLVFTVQTPAALVMPT